MKKFILSLLLMLSCFAYTQNAKAATLNDCGIKDITKTQVINCSDVKLTDLSALKNAKQLKYLTLRNVGLTSIPSSLTSLTSLEYLDLSNNSIKTIPTSITGLKNLGTLNLNNNNISKLSSGVGSLAKLKELHLNANSLTYLPSVVTKLKSLRVLEARDNSLNSTVSLDGLINLERLDLANNLLLNVGSISKTKVKSLNLSNNVLSKKSIKSRVATFKIGQQNTVTVDKTNPFIKVNYLWYNKDNTIINSLKLSNGKKPVGYKSYDIVSTIKNKKAVELSEYLTQGNNVLKNETLYIKVRLRAYDNSSLTITKRVKLILNTNEKPADKTRREINALFTLLGVNASNGGSGIQASPSSESDLDSLFNNSFIVKDSSFFTLLRYYIITALLIILIFLPLLVLLIITRRTYKELKEI